MARIAAAKAAAVVRDNWMSNTNGAAPFCVWPSRIVWYTVLGTMLANREGAGVALPAEPAAAGDTEASLGIIVAVVIAVKEKVMVDVIRSQWARVGRHRNRGGISKGCVWIA